MRAQQRIYIERRIYRDCGEVHRIHGVPLPT